MGFVLLGIVRVVNPGRAKKLRPSGKTMGSGSNIPIDEDQFRPEARGVLMAAVAFIVEECRATGGEFCLHERLQFILSQRFSRYFGRRPEGFGVLGAGVIEYRKQASQGADRWLVACLHCGEQVG
jgi:hypothetical protein